MTSAAEGLFFIFTKAYFTPARDMQIFISHISLADSDFFPICEVFKYVTEYKNSKFPAIGTVQI